MIQIHFNSMVDREIRWRHEELIKEAMLERLARESMKSQQSKLDGKSRMLAKIGRELIDLGASLEERYGSEPGEE